MANSLAGFTDGTSGQKELLEEERESGQPDGEEAGWTA